SGRTRSTAEITWSPRATTWTSTRWLLRYCVVSRASRSSSSTYTTRISGSAVTEKVFITAARQRGRETSRNTLQRSASARHSGRSCRTVPPVRRSVLCALVALAPAQGRADGIAIVGGSPRAIGRAGAATVGDDGGGALLINPAAMARRDTTRAQPGASPTP